MHVFIGGAYNGKTDYVRRLYEPQQMVMIAGELPEVAPACDVLVLKNLEKWLVTQNLEEDEQIVQKVLAITRA